MGFFDDLFGKKKQQPQGQNVQAHVPPQKAQALEQEQGWVYELILQYLTSPIWKVTISQFIDDNCLVFDDEEENKIEYQAIHRKFKKLMESLIDGLLNELMINEQQLEEAINIGLRNSKDKAVFEQLLIIDNFLVLKKLMIKRNKELELEALREMQKADKLNNRVGNEASVKQAELEKEKADLEHAIALSKAVEEERKKHLQQEEDELNQAIMMSQRDYQNYLTQQQKELQLKEQQMREQQLQEIEEQKRQQQLAEQAKVVNQISIAQKVPQVQQQQQQQQQAALNNLPPNTPTPVSNMLSQKVPQKVAEPEIQFSDQKPSMLDIYGQSDEKPKEVKPEIVESSYTNKMPSDFKVIPQHQQQGSKHLPPIKPVIQQVESQILAFDEDEEQREKDRKIQLEQIQKLKSQGTMAQNELQQVESVDERKKRLLAQRELLKKKKDEERNKQLEEYKEQQQQQLDSAQQLVNPLDAQKKNTNDEIQRRRLILEQKKRELANKKHQEEDYDHDLL